MSNVLCIGPRGIKDGKLTDFQPKKGERTGGNKSTVPLSEKTAVLSKMALPRSLWLMFQTQRKYRISFV